MSNTWHARQGGGRPGGGAVRRWAWALLACLVVAGGAARAEAPAAAPPEAPAGLGAALDAIVGDAAIGNAVVGASVVDLKSGETWYGHLDGTLLNVASNAKLLTTAAVLDRLGPTASFPTELYGHPVAGAIEGDLVIRGGGNPKLAAKDIARIAESIKAAGVRRVKGRIVVDDSLFGGASLPPAYDQKDTDEAYRCAVGALTLEYGALAVTFRPGAVGQPPKLSVAPDGDDVDWVNEAKTVEGKEEKLTVRASAGPDGRTTIRVTGTIGAAHKGGLVRRRVEDPGLVTGHVLREALRRRGITVDDLTVIRGRAPEADQPMISVPSLELQHLARDCNEWSNNHMAEVFLLHVGAAAAGAPGTAEKGAAAVRAMLTKAGVPEGDGVVRNGSGLYDGVRLSAAQMTTFLRFAWGQEALRGPYLASLPVAGKTGTLRARMRKTAAAGRVHAKTGTLDGVITLSGYVETRSGRWLAFSVLINGVEGGPGPARGLQDRFAARLAGL